MIDKNLTMNLYILLKTKKNTNCQNNQELIQKEK